MLRTVPRLRIGYSGEPHQFDIATATYTVAPRATRTRPQMQHAIPSPDDTEDLLLSCRYGDLDDAKSFIDRFGTAPLGETRDENGNTILHMASANGHTGEWTPTHLFPISLPRTVRRSAQDRRH